MAPNLRSPTEELRYLAAMVACDDLHGPLLLQFIRRMQRKAGVEYSAAARSAARSIAQACPAMSAVAASAALGRVADDLDAARTRRKR
jgi:hypothetical protein